MRFRCGDGGVFFSDSASLFASVVFITTAGIVRVGGPPFVPLLGELGVKPFVFTPVGGLTPFCTAIETFLGGVVFPGLFSSSLGT